VSREQVKVKNTHIQNRKEFHKRKQMPWLKAAIIILLSLGLPVRGGWTDPDTPEDKRTTTSLIDGTEYELVRQWC